MEVTGTPRSRSATATAFESPVASKTFASPGVSGTKPVTAARSFTASSILSAGALQTAFVTVKRSSV